MNTVEELKLRIELIKSEVDEINSRLRDCEENQVIDLENNLEIAEANLEALQDEYTYLIHHKNIG